MEQAPIAAGPLEASVRRTMAELVATKRKQHGGVLCHPDEQQGKPWHSRLVPWQPVHRSFMTSAEPITRY